MGLILNQSLKKLTKGYPTRTAKEQVEGGIVASTSANILPGNVICFTSTAGEFTATFDATKIAGIALATNVKLVTEYPGESKDAPFCPGEAINLMISGYIAMELDSSLYTVAADGTVTFDASIVEGAAATTDGEKITAVGAQTGFNAVFTGVVEYNNGKGLAEIKYNM